MKTAWLPLAGLIIAVTACGGPSQQTLPPQQTPLSTARQPAPDAAEALAEAPPAVPVAAQDFSTSSDVAGYGYGRTQYHEFQADCPAVAHAHDDPIVYPGKPGASHDHTFFGNRTTDAFATEASLAAGTTSCQFAGDRSAYWTPTLFSHGKTIDPDYAIVYYKSGIDAYPTVKPFPKGLKIIAGFALAKSPADFPGTWSCGNTHNVKDFPATCPAGSSLIARLKAPSCWDGVHLDSLNHRDHMAYPVRGACPADHPVAVPMLEFKIPYEVDGANMGLALASGPGYTFHEDFIAAWDDSQNALVARCINGGRQCGPTGYDPHKP